jgi:hypothetical protein
VIGVTEHLRTFHYAHLRRNGDVPPWTRNFREKAALCERLADGLSLNNPGRFQLLNLAEDFQKRAKELETQEAEQQQSKS